jgi:nitroreductase
MDALEAIKQRRSIRKFGDSPVDRRLLDQLVDCGRMAPTAMTKEPWEFVVVTDEQMKGRIADMTDYGKFIADAPACIAVFCRDTKYYLEDGCAATENMLIAAAALGLGACWVAGDEKRYADEVRRMLGVPDGHRLVTLLPVGLPADQPSVRGKRAAEEVLHWERHSGGMTQRGEGDGDSGDLWQSPQ